VELSQPFNISDLVGRKVCDQSGRRIGRVFEARAHWEADGTVVIDELLVGRGGLLKRLRGPGPGPDARGIAWEAITEVGAETIVMHQ